MEISHWGIFPGYFEQLPERDGSFKIAGERYEWMPCDFDLWLDILDYAAEGELARFIDLPCAGSC